MPDGKANLPYVKSSCHFRLNLQNVRKPSGEVHAARFNTIPESRLTSLLTGNLGEDLSHGFEIDRSDDEEASARRSR